MTISVSSALFVIVVTLLALGLSCAAAPAPPAASTRSLYSFTRDDTANVTRIDINAAHTGATPLSPYVFGNFIEHLSDAVYRCLWADTLLNPSLERNDSGDTAPQYWELSGGASWQQDNAGYLSPSCVRLAGAGATLSQVTYLPIRRERSYTLTLYLRAPSGPSHAVMSLATEPAGAGAPLALASLSADGSAWTKQT